MRNSLGSRMTQDPTSKESRVTSLLNSPEIVLEKFSWTYKINRISRGTMEIRTKNAIRIVVHGVELPCMIITLHWTRYWKMCICRPAIPCNTRNLLWSHQRKEKSKQESFADSTKAMAIIQMSVVIYKIPLRSWYMNECWISMCGRCSQKVRAHRIRIVHQTRKGRKNPLVPAGGCW